MVKKRSTDSHLIAKGITKSGEKFRPGDWAERISGSLSTFKNRRMQYSPLLQPTTKNGITCLVIDPKLEKQDPKTYAEIMQFIKDNDLQICDENDEDTP